MMEGNKEQDKLCAILASKVKPGRLLPNLPVFNSSPWRLPLPACRDAAKINAILSNSLAIQSATIPGNVSMDRYILSNACLVVSGLLKHYFGKLEVADKIRLTYGVLLWPEGIRHEFDGIPHVWLNINGCIIDNTYVEIPNSPQVEYSPMLGIKVARYYQKCNPTTSNYKMFLGSDESPDLIAIGKHNMTLFNACTGSTAMTEKFIALGTNVAQPNPCSRMYDYLMRKHLKETYQVDIAPLHQVWSLKCWSCENASNHLFTCSKCKTAKYCNATCQRADWKEHKLLHQVL